MSGVSGRPIGNLLSSFGRSLASRLRRAGFDQAQGNPSAGEIIMYLRHGYGSFVVDMPSGKRHVPEEIWIPALACWVRADGSAVCGDRGRGHSYFGRFNRWRVRRAADEFRRLKERMDQLIVKLGLASVDTLPKGGDAKQGSVRSKGSAVRDSADAQPPIDPSINGNR